MKTRLSISAVSYAFCAVNFLLRFPTEAGASDINPPPEPSVTLPFKYRFSVDGNLDEKGEMSHSSSPYWWVSSGGFMELKGGVGRTIQGGMDLGEKCQVDYDLVNPIDTDDGRHPQNIFRMVLRSKEQDVSQEMFYKIEKINLSASLNRNQSNGLLQMSRYLDQDNLYYTGLRVDGQATIKKKYRGDYYDLDDEPVIAGVYDRELNPNFLPVGAWIGLRTVIKNLDAARVSIKLFADIGRTGTWSLVASATDDGVSYGGPALTDAGYVGVRTDFMNAQFEDFSLENAD
jgi:hypothetical protein